MHLEKIRIALVTGQLEDVTSGIGIHSRIVARHLSSKGYELHLIFPSDIPDTQSKNLPQSNDQSYTEHVKQSNDPSLTDGWKKAILHPIRPTQGSFAHASWLVLSKRLCEKFNKVEKRLIDTYGKGFDIVHFTDARMALNLARTDAAKVGNMNDCYFAQASINPFKFAKHYSDWPQRFLYYHLTKRLEHKALRKLDRIICNTNYVKESISFAYPDISDKTVVIYKALPENVLIKSRHSKPAILRKGPSTDVKRDQYKITPAIRQIEPILPESRHVLLFVGGNYQRKGLTLIIRSLKEIIRKVPDVHLVVIGKDRNEKHLMQLACKLSVESHISFLGYKPHEEVDEYFRQLSKRNTCFTMPSLIEAFGVVYLEAMQHGIPVIASKLGGTKEMITDGDNGYLVDPNDQEELTQKTLFLLTDKKTRARFIKNGKLTVKRFSEDRMICMTERLYHSILDIKEH